MNYIAQINLIFLNFKTEDIGDIITQVVIKAIRENDLKRNRDSGLQRIRIERNREPRILRNGEHLKQEHEGSRYDNPGRDTSYVTRDEFFKEIGRIEGKIEQYRMEQSTEMRDGFDSVGKRFQHMEEKVENLLRVVTKEVDDVQDVKNIENVKKLLEN